MEWAWGHTQGICTSEAFKGKSEPQNSTGNPPPGS